MPLLADGGIDADVASGEAAVTGSTGVDPKPWFRCPFGEGADDPRVVHRLALLGYRNVHWHVGLDDWEPWRTGRTIANDGVAASLEHGDGAVILLHTWPAGTGDALEPMVRGLREAGASFVTVDQLEPLP
jgi:peptidoglycan/xylan/chitin deacetylase (PgdA/CDA1 family)